MRIFRETCTAIVSVVLVASLSGCQEGLLRYEAGALNGYTLVDRVGLDLPAHLIDMQGNVIHISTSEALFTKMMPGGSMLTTVDRRLLTAYAEGVSLLQEDWYGTVEWTFREWEYSPLDGWVSRCHHDLQREGNPVGYYAPGQDHLEQGNTLVLAHADETRPEISSIPLVDDIIYEVDWEGNPVFEWHAADHVDEFGFDPAARAAIDSYGGDWLHGNAVSWLGQNPWYSAGDTRFHPKNIMFDSRHGCFIVIIDHQTGDVVWRVGPDYSEGNPEAALGPIIGPHHAHMIPEGLPGEGNILLFDNGGEMGYGGPNGGAKYSRDHSRVIEFDPRSLEIVWDYDPANGDYLRFSRVVGGAQRLPNGNTLITSGVRGLLLEVMPDRQIVWEYINPFDQLLNRVYRAYRIPPEWLPENPAGYSPWIP